MQKILFITLSNIGDAVMTTPVLERLHQIYPEASIDLVCDPRSQSIFEYCPYRGEIFLKIKQQGRKGLFQLIKRLRKKRYDLIVDLRTDGLAYLLRSKKRLTKWGHKAYGPHAVEDLISIIDAINPEKIIPDTNIWLDEIVHSSKAEKLTSALTGSRWLALGPGANWPPKVWAAENFARLANTLNDMIEGVIIIGADSDAEYSNMVVELINLPVLDLTGKTDLLTASAILRECSLFIGNDSGLGHLASAVRTPCITVFGPGKPQRYHPWAQEQAIFQGNNGTFKGLEMEKIVQQAETFLKFHTSQI